MRWPILFKNGLGFYGLHAPWNSLNFKIKIQGLENPWKLQSLLESPWISVLTLSNPDSHVPKRSKHRKIFRIFSCLCCERNKKDIDSRLFLALNGVLGKWEMCPWKSLKSSWIFCSKKGTYPGTCICICCKDRADCSLFIVTHTRQNPCKRNSKITHQRLKPLNFI